MDDKGKVIHPKYYKHLKKGAHQSHLGRQKINCVCHGRQSVFRVLEIYNFDLVTENIFKKGET